MWFPLLTWTLGACGVVGMMRHGHTGNSFCLQTFSLWNEELAGKGPKLFFLARWVSKWVLLFWEMTVLSPKNEWLWVIWMILTYANSEISITSPFPQRDTKGQRCHDEGQRSGKAHGGGGVNRRLKGVSLGKRELRRQALQEHELRTPKMLLGSLETLELWTW